MSSLKINLVENPHIKVWVLSDTHYNHTNICRGITRWGITDEGGVFHPNIISTRDFKSLWDMNQTIVNNINSLVGEDDIIIHDGDVAFGGFDSIPEFRNQIICKNIHQVLGNHDHHIKKNKNNVQELFSSVDRELYLTVITEKGKYHFFFNHFPYGTWDNIKDGVIHLHGHLHSPKNKRFRKGKMMDVGIDGNDFKPYNILWIIDQMDEREIDCLIYDDYHVNKG